MYTLRMISYIFFAICYSESSQVTTKPHIVVIIGDDIGWNDFSFHGSSQIPTPNIDAIGYNGVFLNKFYTQAICSPSRAAFLTGKYPIRYGYQGSPVNAGEDRPIPENLQLLPEKLKELGYKTHLIGKWHLSAGRKSETPTRRGFDSHFGYWNGYVGYFDYSIEVNPDKKMNETWYGLDLHDGFIPKWEYQGQYATEVFTQKSIDTIDNHNTSEPLFLYLGHLAAHTGANGTELGVPNITETEQKYFYIEEPYRRRYAEVVSQLDKSVGQVVKKLKDRSMLENSIVLFFSDNGALSSGMFQNFGSNYPYKGLKVSLFEGGVRGSAVLFSPLLSKKGYINDQLIHITDLFSTFLYAAGGHPEELDDLDGINQWETISENASSLREEILINIDEIEGFSGLIGNFGRYKFLNGSYKNGIHDAAQGDTGRSINTPSYDIDAVLNSDVNQAIESLKMKSPLTPQRITDLRKLLDISFCNGKVRTTDPPCLGECLFDLVNDPCEVENIVNEEPLIADSLKARLEEYVQQIEPEGNAKIDPKSNPEYCNNTWFPWLDEDGCFYTVSKNDNCVYKIN